LAPSDFEAVFVVVPPLEDEPDDVEAAEESEDERPDVAEDAEPLAESELLLLLLLLLEPCRELPVELLRTSLRESVR
jgi:hypothetical protein